MSITWFCYRRSVIRFAQLTNFCQNNNSRPYGTSELSHISSRLWAKGFLFGVHSSGVFSLGLWSKDPLLALIVLAKRGHMTLVPLQEGIAPSLGVHSLLWLAIRESWVCSWVHSSGIHSSALWSPLALSQLSPPKHVTLIGLESLVLGQSEPQDNRDKEGTRKRTCSWEGIGTLLVVVLRLWLSKVDDMTF